ncbi:BRCT domain-containing protein [Bdellovibrio sp.]|uniref:BRCT domain-containing protein n=1 Tax=Bdellovibrio sp. TaxID=28201 RepID=UPI0039E70D06
MKKQIRYSETYIHNKSTTDKALTVLKGIIEGVISDQALNDLEYTTIKNWIDNYSFLQGNAGVHSVFESLYSALEDGVFTVEECKDILWAIDKCSTTFYDDITQRCQELHGLLIGIAADRVILSSELSYLWTWLNDNEVLKGLFPYDEIYSLIMQIGHQKTLSQQEKDFLIQACSWTENKSISTSCPLIPWEVDPMITFKGKTFCITGGSKRGPRAKIIEEIVERGGKVVTGISKSLGYLVVCEEANVAWTHATYGRKIEGVIMHRRNGSTTALICEADLWDALNV